MVIGPIGFGAPWVLLGLVMLPVLYWFLRVSPPVPRRIWFPGTTLLAGLEDSNPVAQRTPWWLLVLRLLAMAMAVIAFAEPIWRPAPTAEVNDTDALLIVIDAGATAAPDWTAVRTRAIRAAEEAKAQGQPVAVLLADGQNNSEALVFRADSSLPAVLRAASPQPWPGAYPGEPEDMLVNVPKGNLQTLWLSDGLEHPGRAGWLSALTLRGRVRIVLPALSPVSLRMVRDGEQPLLDLALSGKEKEISVVAYGPDTQGVSRELARLQPEAGQIRDKILHYPVPVNLPAELLGRVTRFQVEGVESAAAVVLSDDRLRQPVVVLADEGRATSEEKELLSPGHYLRNALSGLARLVETGVNDALSAKPDVIILVDQVGVSADGALADWVNNGGLLIRFAGPRTATDSGLTDEPLLPVRLRPGGRDVGGALSWDEPRKIIPFSADSLFAGLNIPDDVTVRAQLMAEPGPDLTARTIVTLDDGTPLVTRRVMGKGQIVFFHTSADAEWSSLPLSGLFIDMLERLIASAGRSPGEVRTPDAHSGTWIASHILDGFGRLDPAQNIILIDSMTLSKGAAPGVPAGVYKSSTGERIVAVNAGGAIESADWPGGMVEREHMPGFSLTGWLLLSATVVLILDMFGSIFLRRRHMTVAALSGLLLFLPFSNSARTQDIDPVLARAATEFSMGYILTGDEKLDEISKAGLTGLTQILTDRTTVEPSAPVAIDIEKSDLSLMSFLYWPIGPDQPVPTIDANLQLNRFLRSGGMILFDTRDADIAGTGPDGSVDLRRLAGALDLPALQVIPKDHVLTRSYYLLNDMPGRYANGDVWVETTASALGTVNDGVSSVVLGGNNWAEAWAVDNRGLPMFQVGIGGEGIRQRELSYRFGVNLIMYALTGNYKSDQLHASALLELLGLEEER